MAKLNARETENLIMVLERVLKEICNVTDVSIIIGVNDFDDYLNTGVDDEISPQEAPRAVGSL